jgi:hypothetical protein
MEGAYGAGFHHIGASAAGTVMEGGCGSKADEDASAVFEKPACLICG